MNNLILRIPFNMNNFIYKNKEFNSFYTYKDKLNVIEDIINEKDLISEKLHRFISFLNNEIDRKKLINLRRKLYTTLNPIRNIEDFDYLLPNEILGLLLNDNQNRMLLKKLDDRLYMEIKNETILVENIIKEQLNTEWFKSALLAANTGLYNSIFNRPVLKLDKNKYTTLLRYLYKSFVMCTPSSIWAGVLSASWGKDTNLLINNKNTTFSIEFNSNISKHIAKKKFKKYLCDDSTLIYLNPTIYLNNEYIYYWKTEYGVLKKCRISSSSIMLELLSKKNKKYSINELRIILEQYIEDGLVMNLIENMVDMDIVKIYGITFFDDINPLKTISKVIDNEADINKVNKVYFKCDEDFRENFIDLNNYGSEFDSSAARVNVSFGKQKITVKNDVQIMLSKSVKTYYKLYSSLYGQLTQNKFKDYIVNNHGKDVLVPILEISFNKKNVTEDYKKKNYKAWFSPAKNLDQYHKFIKLIKDKLTGEKQVIYLSDKEIDNLIKEISNVKKEVEIIFQTYTDEKQDTYIIPEMFSTHKGRLAGRFLKLISEEERKNFFDNFYESISNTDVEVIQGNIHINNDLDGIGFSNPNITKELYIYDNNVRPNKESIAISDLYLKFNSGTNKITTHLNNGKEVSIWNASSISPGADSIYGLLNNISHQDIININGHAFNRIELDLDYQPRICVGNLVLSRERYRYKKNVFEFLEEKTTLEDKLIKLYQFIIEKKLPSTFFVYTDTDYKAKYNQLLTVYDLLIFHRSIKSSKDYVYIEEMLPNENHYNNQRNMEVWSGVCLTI